MNLQQAAQQALDCQDACNLSGVLHSLDRIVTEVLWPESDRIGCSTDWINQHPIVTLFLDKLASLNCSQCLCERNMGAFKDAFAQVEELAATGNCSYVA
jgi:hypothetical protein